MGKNRKDHSCFVVGIDAANLRQGGGVTHLVELLRAAVPAEHGISKVVVWGGSKTLATLEDRPWLEKRNPPELDQGLFHRMRWQRFQLSNAAEVSGCDLLFVPGGSYAGFFKPIVTMCRNMLPFEWRELRRYGWSLVTLKLLLLRWTQLHTFRQANGVIFLTEYARKCVLRVTGKIAGNTPIIPHGLNPRFQRQPKVQRPITDYSSTRPYRLLYVSIIDQYKHQWHVIEAVAALRSEGMHVVLDLVGPAYPPALVRLNKTIAQFDPEGIYARYHGGTPYSELHQQYAQADLGIFASSCENMPNILLETMASGLPVACSSRGPMQEVLGDAGLYFDPEQPADIARALRELIKSPQLRAEKARVGHMMSQGYSWPWCATETFDFLARIARQYRDL